MDIYAQHDSKAGTDMSAEVTEILDNVHQMSTAKRLLIGAGVLLLAAAAVGAMLLLIL